MILRATVPLSVLLALLAFLTVHAVEVTPDLSPSAYIAKADELLAQGEYQDALQFYDAAVKRDPQNYLSLFKRGAVYLSVGRLNQAMSDFDKALELNAGFESALMQRGKLRLKTGDWKGAIKDFKALSGDHAEDIRSVSEAEKETAAAKAAQTKGNTDECIVHTSAAITLASSYAPLRRLRAECRLAKGLIREAVADLSHLINANPLLPEPYVRIASLQFVYLNERDKAIAQLAKCLHYDPDSKDCKQNFREYKRLDKDIAKAMQLKDKRLWSSFEKAVVHGASGKESVLKRIESMGQAIDSAEHIAANAAPKELELDILESLCEAYFEMSKWGPGSPFCARVLELRPESVSALLFTAKVHINKDELQEAIDVLNKAKEVTGGQNEKVMHLLRDASILLKRANTKDYYKVLGVSRDAGEKEIKKAYRNKTKEFHPDKYRGDLKPEQVEKKMAEINEAYEVLSTPELRERFDNGDDPNDHSSPGRAQQGGYDPFQHQQNFGGFSGGFPGGGGRGGGQQQYFQQGGKTFYRQSSGGGQRQQSNFKFHF